jgi:adenylate cyclase class IV
MIKDIEVEAKYRSHNIKYSDFKNLVDKLKPRWQEVASWDDYYTHKLNKDDFNRYRNFNGEGQITSKEKISDINNNRRIEYNITLGKNDFSTIEEWHKSKGYKHNFRIFKTCFIAWLDKVDIVYYVVYNEELKEIDRFIEVEALESYPWKDEEEAWNEVLKYEKILEPLGIVPQNRMRKSLFEMYQK